MRRLPVGTLALACVLAACGVADEGDRAASTATPTATATSPATAAATATPAATPTLDLGATPEDSMDPSLAAVVEAASRDVRTRIRTSDEVRVVSAEEGPVRQDTLDWCAARGTVVDDASFRVVVGIGERVWVYLAGPDGEPVLCPTDEPDQGTGFVPPPGIDD